MATPNKYVKTQADGKRQRDRRQRDVDTKSQIERGGEKQEPRHTKTRKGRRSYE